MLSLSHKSKQYLLVTLKVLLLGITFSYIYFKLAQTDRKTWSALLGVFDRSEGSKLSYLLLFLLLAGANWCFEIFKWKLLVSQIQKISWNSALKQCLVSHAISLTTPQRIGEYGAKAFYFKASLRKKILLLNLFSHTTQMGATVLFGLLGSWWVLSAYSIPISITSVGLIIAVLLLIVLFAYVFKDQQLLIKGLKVSSVFGFFSRIEKNIKIRVMLLSLARFLTFSILFYLLMDFFGAPISFISGFSIIFTTYLLVSVVPSIFLLDVVIRGGVAIWLFSFVGISEIPVLCTILTMWLLNFVAPALLGSIYLVSFQPATQ